MTMVNDINIRSIIDVSVALGHLIIMLRILNILFLFTSFSMPLLMNGLRVSNLPDGFVVYIDDLPLISHTADSPLAAVGSSKSNFTENQGNFIIEENIEEKIELPQYSIDTSALPRLISARLSNRIAPDTFVTIVIEEVPSDVFRVAARIDIQVSGRDRLWFRTVSNPNEKIYGGGEQFTFLNLKGREYPIWTREQGVGRNRSSPLAGIVEETSPGAAGDYHTTYYPAPIFMSNLKYVIQGEQEGYSVMNFTDPLVNEFYVHDRQLALNIGTAASLRELVTGINRAASRIPPTLPEWIYNGAIVATQGGTQNMLDRIQSCLDNGVNISAVWIQDWSGKIQTSFGYRVFWNWRWNPELYPGLDALIPELSGRGIQVTAYINPHLNVEGDLFQEADRLGYLLKNGVNNESYKQDFGEFLAGTIDFSNPIAKQWYTELIQKNMIQFGLKGFMADFGEYTPLNSVALNSNDAYKFHNKLPVLWASTVRDALEQSGTLDSILPWARSGFTGAQQYHSIVWAGDQNVDWTESDGLPSSIVGALSMGLSGFGLSHSDIGGYTTLPVILTRSKELLLRWAEYSVFTPLMRTHEGNMPDLNHQIYSDNETLRDFGRLTRMYTTLAPYHKEVVSQVSLEGMPAMRPLFIQYPNDVETFDIQYEYMYGEDLLVAPVLEPRVSKWSLFLPSDRWIYLWDEREEIVTGPKLVTVIAPVGKTPVFYRADSKWTLLFGDVRRLFNF